MIRLIPLFLFIFACVSGLSLKTAFAATSFSVSDWKRDFKNSLDKKDHSRLEKLVDMDALLVKAVPACVDCDSKAKMKKARSLFSKGQYEQSIELYNKIPKGSDQWLVAVEERGWAYFRMGYPEKAMAQSKTLLSPSFAGTVGTESYFLQSLSQLKICDYKGVFETHGIFKEKQKSRILAVQQLSQANASDKVQIVAKKANHFPVQLKELGDEALLFPQLFHKDREVQTQMFRNRLAQSGLEALSTAGNSKLNARLAASFEKIQQHSLNQLTKRIQTLAQQETEDSQKLIQKLNLVEVEAIQRMHSDIEISDEAYAKGNFRQTTDNDLVFMDDGRPWIDELDKYEVSAKACPSNIRRKM